MASAGFNSEVVNDDLPHILTATLAASVHSDNADPSVRQVAVFRKACVERDTDETVRGLVAALNVSEPAGTRTVDRLSEFGLIKRQCDAIDRQSVVVRGSFADLAHVRSPDNYFSEAARI